MKILLHLAEHLQVRAQPLDVGLFSAVAIEQSDEAEHHLHVVADPVLDFPQQHFALGERLFELVFRAFLIGDVESRPEIPAEDSVSGTVGPAVVENPSIGPISAAKPIRAAEFLAAIERARVDRQPIVAILRMDPLGPAEAALLLDCASGETQPRPVEPVRAPVRPGPPNHDGGVVGEQQKILLGVTGLGKAGLGHWAA